MLVGVGRPGEQTVRILDNKNNSELIDRIRGSLIQNFSLNYLRNKLRIINIYNIGQKNFHRLYNISLGKKFTNGFIRNGHDVLEISDRDFIRQNRNLFQTKNIGKFQDYLMKTSKKSVRSPQL